MARKRSGRKPSEGDQQDRWNRFVQEALVEGDENTNMKFDFNALSKKFGRSYIEYCQAAWQANGGCLSDEEFRQVNGGIPEGFFRNVVCAC